MILILTAGYGEGHNAAARGLHAAFTQLGVASEVVDAFALGGGASYDPSRRAYLELINRAPLVWAGIFWLIDKVPLVPLTLPLFGGVQRALAQVLAQKMPKAVISVYPAYGYFLDRLYPEPGLRPFAVHTMVTDSITINSVWYRCSSDTFLVPNEQSAQVMASAQVPREKLKVLGFPVAPRFASERPSRPRPGTGFGFRVLFMINAGKALAPAIVARLLKIQGLELTVTVGRDEELRARVEQAAAGRPISIYGWTDKMPELLLESHLLIGKAGGAAVQESIAACTPMLMTQVVPGQEEGNARLLVESLCGEICRTPEALAKTVERIFADDAREWRVWEQNIQKLSRPDAALKIAEFVLAEIAGSPGAAGRKDRPE